MTFSFLHRALLCLCLIGAGPIGAEELDLSNPAFAPEGEVTSAPIGHYQFCNLRPYECAPNDDFVEAATLTETLWSELLDVNARVNQAVSPVSDYDLYQVDEFWTYPSSYGDCEDYALAKRRTLIEDGWPASVLLISVVRQQNGEGHAVLMVRTDHGDLVLDNRIGSVLLWSETPYQFLKRQSQADAAQWVDVLDSRQPLLLAQK